MCCSWAWSLNVEVVFRVDQHSDFYYQMYVACPRMRTLNAKCWIQMALCLLWSSTFKFCVSSGSTFWSSILNVKSQEFRIFARRTMQSCMKSCIPAQICRMLRNKESRVWNFQILYAELILRVTRLMNAKNYDWLMIFIAPSFTIFTVSSPIVAGTQHS